MNLKNHTYSWQAQPIKIHFEEGGYSPDCGGAPRAMTALVIGTASVGSLPLPTDTDVLCGKATFSDPGDFTANIDWYFFPDDGRPRQAPVCPAAVNPTGGTSWLRGRFSPRQTGVPPALGGGIRRLTFAGVHPRNSER